MPDSAVVRAFQEVAERVATVSEQHNRASAPAEDAEEHHINKEEVDERKK